MRSEQSQWSLSPYQRYLLILEVWKEAKKLTDAGFGNIKFGFIKEIPRGIKND